VTILLGLIFRKFKKRKTIMKGWVRNWVFGFFAFAMSAGIAIAGTKCVEGVYSNMGEAAESRDLYGNSLLIIGQSKDYLSVDPTTQSKVQKPVAVAEAIYSCIAGGDVRSTLSRIEIRYPDFSFQLDRANVCHADNPPVGDERFIIYSGKFSTKGLFISTPCWSANPKKRKGLL
jgi:hypothetical protein